MRQDFAGLLESLRREPQQGVDLGRGLHKVRMAISSKGKGKSGGARVITLTVLISETGTNIVLLTIYDKSECENLTDKELTDIVKKSSPTDCSSYTLPFEECYFLAMRNQSTSTHPPSLVTIAGRVQNVPILVPIHCPSLA